MPLNEIAEIEAMKIVDLSSDIMKKQKDGLSNNKAASEYRTKSEARKRLMSSLLLGK